MYFFLVFSLFLSYICYLSIDPMKRCLYLILSLIVITPFLSLLNEVWYSYFICIIFLRGIFVILVYFTRISKYNFYNFSLPFLIFLGFFYTPFLNFSLNINLFELYYSTFTWLITFLLLNLLYFINFSSYFLNFTGALRKT